MWMRRIRCELNLRKLQLGRRIILQRLLLQEGKSPLHYLIAEKGANPDIAKFLCEQPYIDLTLRDNVRLRLWSMFGITWNSNPFYFWQSGKTALYTAVEEGKMSFVEILLRKQPECINIHSKASHMSPWSILFHCSFAYIPHFAGRDESSSSGMQRYVDMPRKQILGTNSITGQSEFASFIKLSNTRVSNALRYLLVVLQAVRTDFLLFSQREMFRCWNSFLVALKLT